MSVSIKYKGTEIASASTEVTKTIKTAGKYCEADILVENTPDSGDAPVINPLSVTANGTYTAPSGVDGYSPINVNVPQGITPTGNINITDTNVTDVTNYATATVVDADLVASNIKKDVNILGIVGSFEGGGGGSLPPEGISKQASGTFVVSTDGVNSLQIQHNLGETPTFVFVVALNTNAGSGTYFGALTVPANNSLDTINYSMYNNNKSVAGGTTIGIKNITATTFTAERQASNYFMVGIRYYWYAAVVE